MDEHKTYSALLLMSGGLDSQLAACVLRNAGINVKAIVFDSPFFATDKGTGACQALKIPCHVYNFSPDIIALLGGPKHGFGKCMNPCIDCHATMLNRAGWMLEELECDFLATGEVLDERPMSQNRRSLHVVAKDSQYGDLILRPLSAKLLEPTLPEREGWIDREKLLNFHGRGRKRQFALAKEYGVVDYPSPAGGCRLTEPQFCVRLKDMQDHEGFTGVRDIELLRVGRHFRLGPSTKLIVGRDEKENAAIEAACELYDVVFKADSIPGPSALIPLTASEDEMKLAMAICASYGDAPKEGPVTLKVKTPTGVGRAEVTPAKRSTTDPLRI